jgi:putative membrane-bound dehydrogenase-like protein
LAGAICGGAAVSRAASSTSPSDARAAIFHLPAGFDLDAAVSEGLLQAPVAIDWGADGRLWVAEGNVPRSGAPTPAESAGSVKLLSDLDRDGRYDQAAVFLEGLPDPSGVMAWGPGVLVCAAPDLIYAEDTNGDGQTDVAQRLWVGFDAANPALRLNSLSLGLDNWMHGASGSRGGEVRAMARLDPTPLPLSTDFVRLENHDFRFRPGVGELEPVSGSSAFARVRDDWDHWFGGDAEGHLWHYPLPRHYRNRNPHIALPDDAVLAFRASGSSTSTPRPAGLCLKRGGLGETLDAESAFLIDPETRQIRRLILSRAGLAFSAREAPTPFVMSSDPGFEPVQIRMGPDGALWIVDRHGSGALPRATPLAAGRILRVRPERTKLGAIRDLVRLPVAEVVQALDTLNGTERDRVHAHLLHRADPAAATPLRGLSRRSRWSACRAQALCVLDGLRQLTPPEVEAALSDSHPGVRVQAVRLSEPFLRGADATVRSQLGPALLRLVADPEWPVRYQLALSLGEWDDARAGQALGHLAAAGLDDPWLRAAVLTSAARFPDAILSSVLSRDSLPPAAAGFLDSLAVTAAHATNDAVSERFTVTLTRQASMAHETLALGGFARLLEVIRDRPTASPALESATDSPWQRLAAVGAALPQRAHALIRDPQAPEETRILAVRLLGQVPMVKPEDLKFLSQQLVSSDSARLKEAALNALIATRQPHVAELVLAHWSRQPPSVRQAIVGPLVVQPAWARRLLEAVDQGVVATTEVTPVNRERLLNDADPQVRERASAVFAARLPERRREIVAQFTPALSLTGNPAKGRATFENLCSRCHALGGIGSNVGADLAVVSSRTTTELLESILDPAATVEARYVNYQVETDDDRSLSGIVTAESGAEITVVQPGGKSEVVALKAVTDLRASSLSLMPEGLEQGQTLQDLADLLAFIRSQGRLSSR